MSVWNWLHRGSARSTSLATAAELRANRALVYGLIREAIEPVVCPHGFAWHAGNFWTRDVAWAQLSCALGARKRRSATHCELYGGAGIFLREYHSQFQPDFEEFGTKAVPPATMGGPLDWLDPDSEIEDGGFTSVGELRQRLPDFARVFERVVIPALNQYQDEASLFAALMAPDWSKVVRFSLSQDRRAALLTLVIARNRSKEEAAAFASAELARIKQQEVIARPGRWKELSNAIAALDRPVA